MVSFPLRLILAAFGAAALLAGASRATGGTAIGAVMVFWLGGTLLMLVLPLLSARFRAAAGQGADEVPSRLAAEVEAEAAAERRARDHARWAEDLEEERAGAEAAEARLGKTG